MGEGSEGLRVRRSLRSDLERGGACGSSQKTGPEWGGARGQGLGRGLSWDGAGLGLGKDRRDALCRKWSLVASLHHQEDEGGLRGVSGEVDLCSPGAWRIAAAPGGEK